MNRSVFSRILTACLLPLLIIFSLVIIAINEIVYSENEYFTDEKSELFADETMRQIGERFTNIHLLLQLLNNNLLNIDPAKPRSAEIASLLVKSTLKATPHIYKALFVFYPDEFLPGQAFSRLFLKDGENILERDEFIDPADILAAGPVEHNVTFRAGSLPMENVKYYDYILGHGAPYTATIISTLVRNGRAVGMVGISILYEETFRFLDDKQKDGEQKVLLLDRDGRVVYAKDRRIINRNITELGFEHAESVLTSLGHGKPFWYKGFSSFWNKQARLYFFPVQEDLTTNQLYLYVDLPDDTLQRAARNATKTIVSISIMGLILFVGILFYTTRRIVEPIKQLTESAYRIANGDLSIDLNSQLSLVAESKHQKSEISSLFLALKEMLRQLNQLQTVKMEAMEAMYEKEKAEASDRSKSMFLAKMSHEIRTPMNAIIGMAELALREKLPTAANEHVLMIKHAGMNLLSIINDILDFSKIESGKLELVLDDYVFSSLVNDVINIIRMRVLDSPVRFVTNIDSNIPNKLFGDEVRIRQIILNLLSNAVKYTEKGFVALNISCTQQSEETTLLTISVADSGKGIRQEHLGMLFVDFVQLDLVQNRGIEGSGLGLAITKYFVEAMNGKITVESEYGKGSVFTVTLPQKVQEYERLAVVEAPEQKSVLLYERREVYAESILRTLNNLGVQCATVSTDNELFLALAQGQCDYLFVSSFLLGSAKEVVTRLGASPKVVLLTEFGEALADHNLHTLAMPAHAMSIANILNGQISSCPYSPGKEVLMRFSAPSARILIVDDIKTNLKVAEGLMLPYHMHIDLCSSGTDAIAAVQARKYDLVFMDHMMPGMNGIEATMIIRGMSDVDPYLETLPIVALTANAVSGVQDLFMESGFDDFLSKPIDVMKLSTLLRKWIPRQKQQSPIEEGGHDSSTHMTIDGLNVAGGIASTGGSLPGYLRTLYVFLEDGLAKVVELSECLEEGNTPLYVTHVHALKSACASIGAEGLSQRAAQIEDAGRRNDMGFILVHHSSFLFDLQTLLQNIQDALAGQGVVPQVESEVTAEVRAELHALRSAIEALNPEGIDNAVSMLQTLVPGASGSSSLGAVLHNTLIGDYEEVLINIDRLLSPPPVQ